MTDKETDKKEGGTKPEDSSSMGPGMFEMMKKCCPGEEAFSDCAAMMKKKMGAVASMPCCGQGTGKTKPKRSKK